jgi:hypothetical protein
MFAGMPKWLAAFIVILGCAASAATLDFWAQ